LGEVKGKDFIPDQSLALSTYINAENFTTYDVDWKAAIAYLRKETLLLARSAKRLCFNYLQEQATGICKEYRQSCK
jgi:hypothetical protein